MKIRSLFFVITYLITPMVICSQNSEKEPIEIIFVEQVKITDETRLNNFLEDQKPVYKEMMKEIAFTMLSAEKEPIDTASVLQYLDVNIDKQWGLFNPKHNKPGEPVKYALRFNDSIMTYAKQESNSVGFKDVKKIHRLDSTVYLVSDDGSLTKELDLFVKLPVKNGYEPVLKENRLDRKVIHGYNCFKITISRKESFLSDFSLFGFEPTPKFEEKYNALLNPIIEQWFYVTEDIKSNFHPIVGIDETILEKYFPLEGSEQQGFIEGLGKYFYVEKLEINID